MWGVDSVCSRTRGYGLEPWVACWLNSASALILAFGYPPYMLQTEAITCGCKIIIVAMYKHSFCPRESATLFLCIISLIFRVTTGWSYNNGPVSELSGLRLENVGKLAKSGSWSVAGLSFVSGCCASRGQGLSDCILPLLDIQL